MRKIFTIIISLILCVMVFTACGDFRDNEDSDSEEETIIVTLNYGDYTGSVSVCSLKVSKSGTLSGLPTIDGYHWEYCRLKIDNGYDYKFDVNVAFDLVADTYTITLVYGPKWNGDKSVKSIVVAKNGVISGLPEAEDFYWSYIVDKKSIEIKNGDTFKFDKDITITFESSYTDNY